MIIPQNGGFLGKAQGGGGGINLSDQINIYFIVDEDDDYDCDNGDYPSLESEMSVPSPETSLSPRPASLAQSMQVSLPSVIHAGQPP